MPTTNALRGAVGESGQSCVLELTNDEPGPVTASVTVTDSSLCPSHAAYACLLVDAEPRTARVDLNDSKMKIETEVGPGEQAVLVVRLVDLRNGTMCIRLADAVFELALQPRSE